MIPPRVTVRRFFVLLIILIFIVLVNNIGERHIWLNYNTVLQLKLTAKNYANENDQLKNEEPIERVIKKNTVLSNIKNGSFNIMDNIVRLNYTDESTKLPKASASASASKDKSQTNTVKIRKNVSDNKKTKKPWYMKGGSIRPKKALRDYQTGKRIAKLFPSEENSDRITNQLMYIPPNYNPLKTKFKTIEVKNVRLRAELRNPNTLANCPVRRCRLARNNESADAVIHTSAPIFDRDPKSSNQIWIIYNLESARFTQYIARLPNIFNWTATYRRDSDIVTPYEHWVYYDPKVKHIKQLNRNYAANKTKKVAWFVSHCQTPNNRINYVKTLQRYIDVDIYGKCGPLVCSRKTEQKCFNLLKKDYKFYLSFENNNCKDYITEKFFVNGLGQDILPIAMGASIEDYRRVAPYQSFLHVKQFSSPRHLAEYLHQLDKDDNLYNSYFEWKNTGEFINTYFWCRVCAMLHDEAPRKSYDMRKWWITDSECQVSGFWEKLFLFPGFSNMK